MKNLTTSATVNRELSNMAESKAVTKSDYSKAIIIITVASIASLITAACLIFGI